MTAMNFPPVPTGAVMAFDTETTGLTQRRDRAFGFSVAFDDYAGYVDIRETPRALLWLAGAVSSASRVVCHNAPFDAIMIDTAGLPLPLDKLDDTVTRACLIDEHEREYSLDYLAKKYLKASKDDSMYEKLSGIFGGRATRNVQMRNIAAAPSSVVAPYAVQDARLTLRLWQWQEAEIKRQGIEQIVEFERSVTPTLIRMAARGIRVDVQRAEEARTRILVQRDEAQRELDVLIGRAVNVNSGPQIKAIFEPVKKGGEWYVGGHQLEKTDSGAASIDSAALRSMEGDRRAELILAVRSLIKTADTFLAKHVLASAVNGRVYPSINQTKGESAGTVTGRLSYTTPALQQIPSRNKAVASVVKPVFLPDEGHVWLDSDLSSNEVRVFGHLINDPKVNQRFKEDIATDFHAYVGQLTGLPRNARYAGEPNAKTLNLSMIFCKGNGSIADTLGMPWEWNEFTTDEGEHVRYKKAGEEAMAMINNYHSELPGVKALATTASKVAGARGYIRTKWGRRLRFPDKRFLYKASGLLIQATAADINKVLIRELDKMLPKFGAHLVLNTHDSYSISAPADRWKEVADAAKMLVHEEFKWMNVPLLLEVSGIGSTWWGALNDELGGLK